MRCESSIFTDLSRSYLGLATRLCIEIGLHRRTKVRQATLKAEIEKRLFWSCYFLDREVSIALGRPSAVSDRDIDVQVSITCTNRRHID